MGFSLTVVLPSAFVALPSAAIHALQPPARLRIVAAGAFHNLLFWLVLQSLAWSQLSSAIWSLVYRDTLSFGRVVVDVDTVSKGILWGEYCAGVLEPMCAFFSEFSLSWLCASRLGDSQAQ